MSNKKVLQTAVVKEGSIEWRIYVTLNNIAFQKGIAMFDDIEKLEHMVGLLKLGKKLDSPWRFLTDKEWGKAQKTSVFQLMEEQMNF